MTAAQNLVPRCIASPTQLRGENAKHVDWKLTHQERPSGVAKDDLLDAAVAA